METLFTWDPQMFNMPLSINAIFEILEVFLPVGILDKIHGHEYRPETAFPRRSF